MPLEHRCPDCGTELNSDSLEGLCPKCVGRGAFVLASEHSAPVQKASPESVKERVGEVMARLKPEEVGDQIGPYKLLQTIGEGGFGTVWMAEQEKPVRRRVALKIIKMGMDTKEVVARFEQERQALAMMDHPNIAKVFDAGATQWGRPYFAMELVRGIKITDFCDQANLSTPERLRLFILTCNAVQHAHQKGIIHRDIKPSNVLVTLHDGVAVPKVIDFGVAKATQSQRLTDLTLFTQFEQMIGTPLYMSPEQAEMSGLDIDTRTDIYSLGVLLYELLTGRTPFDPEELMRKGHDEIRRAIREQEPKKPSTFVSTMAVDLRSTVAQHRQSDPAKLTSLLRGDLDWIVMKALEKDRSRRYETANGLARDIERHLADEPVHARPASQLYRFRRLVRRNKGAFAAASLVVLALVVGFTVSTASLFKEKEARKEAVASQRNAESAAVKSQQVARFLQDMLKHVGPQKAMGRDTVLLKGILDETAARIGKDLGNQPGVEAELRETLGDVYFDLGEREKAEEMYKAAIQLNVNSGAASYKVSTARLLNALAETLDELGRLPDAEKTATEALALNREVHGEVHPGVAMALHHLGKILWSGERLIPANAHLSEAVEQWRKLGAMDDPDAALALNDLGLVMLDSGDMPKAEQLFKAALVVRQTHFGDDHPFVSESRSNVGLALWYQGNLAEAEVTDSEALSSRERVLGESHPNLANSCNNLALVLRDRGKLADAEKLQRRALALVTKQLDPNDSRSILTRNNVATVVRRRAVETGDMSSLREALQFNPADVLTGDAIAAIYAMPSLSRLAGSGDESGRWRYTSKQPKPGWMNVEFQDNEWSTDPAPHGSATVYPRTPKTPIVTHVDIWLRQDLQMGSVPQGQLVFRINGHQDAEIYINGVLAAPAADWSDCPVLLRCSKAAQAALIAGHNILAVHCQDTDGGFPIDVQALTSNDESVGRKQLIGDYDALVAQDPTRAEVYMGRADARARQGQWDKAMLDLEIARRLQPTNSSVWYALGVLRAWQADSAGYEQARSGAIDQFAKDDSPLNAERVVRMATILPPQHGSAGGQLKRLADLAASADYPRGLGWRQLAKALAALRAGEFLGALEWADKSLETSLRKELPGWSQERERNRSATAFFVKTLALNRLDRDDEARDAFAKAAQLIDAYISSIETHEFGREWPDALFALTLRKECEAVTQAK